MKMEMFFEYWFEKIGGVQVILNCRYDPKFVLTKMQLLPTFYRDIIYMYFSYKENIFTKKDNVLK